jgi:anti-sigma factor RsiW
VPDRAAHPSSLILEQLAEGTLSPSEARAAEAHLEGCGRCSAEMESHQHLFAMLGELPRFEPSLSFSDAVMARVNIQPQESYAVAWLRRLIPRTRRGWVLLGAAVTSPTLPILALLAWIVSQPLLSPATLWQWGSLRTQSMAQAAIAGLVEVTAGAGLASMGDAIYSTLQSIPASALGGVVAVLAVAIPLSGWGLVRLTRIPDGSTTYVS